jgi:hypothetical protein
MICSPLHQYIDRHARSLPVIIIEIIGVDEIVEGVREVPEFLLRHIQTAEPISCLHGFLIRTLAEFIRVLYTVSKLSSDVIGAIADRKRPFIYNFAFRSESYIQSRPEIPCSLE